MKKKLIPMLVLAGLLIMVSIQNTQSVNIKFIFWEKSISLILLIYITFLAGIFFGYLYTRIHMASTKRKQKKEEAAKKKESLKIRKAT